MHYTNPSTDINVKQSSSQRSKHHLLNAIHDWKSSIVPFHLRWVTQILSRIRYRLQRHCCMSILLKFPLKCHNICLIVLKCRSIWVLVLMMLVKQRGHLEGTVWRWRKTLDRWSIMRPTKISDESAFEALLNVFQDKDNLKYHVKYLNHLVSSLLTWPQN